MLAHTRSGKTTSRLLRRGGAAASTALDQRESSSRSTSCSTRRRRSSTSALLPAACRARRPGLEASPSASARCRSPSSPKPAVSAAGGRAADPGRGYMFRVLDPIVTHYPETRALYAPNGRLLREGDLFRFSELADALERLGEDGPDWIYRGRWRPGESAPGCASAAAGSRPDDFAAYRVIERRPVRRPTGAAGAHEPAAVVGRHPDRLRARPARALRRGARRG